MRLGFIGTGNMGSSIIGGAIKSNFIVGKNVNIYDLDTEKCSELVDKYSVNISENEIEVTKNSDIIILAVKPNIYNSVLSKIAEEITQDKIIITIAAGYSISQVQQTIVRQLDALRAETQKLEAVYQKKLDDLEELKKSVLQKAFAGEL